MGGESRDRDHGIEICACELWRDLGSSARARAQCCFACSSKADAVDTDATEVVHVQHLAF
jgi:hypothetical protein